MITDIRLQGFRSHRNESFEFSDGVNIIVGPNASGKTNLLEAILVLCRGGSYRAKDAELIMHRKPWARLDSTLPARTVKLMRQDNGLVKKEYVIQDQKLLRLLFAKQIPVVLFEPNHLLLLQGAPELRRDYIDHLLEQLTPGYGQLLRDYKRALAQRNALLKHGKHSTNQLFVWDIRLSETGGKIATERLGLLVQLNKTFNKTYQKLASSKQKKVTLAYETNCQTEDYTSSLLKQLEARREIDVERGYTTVGPHRDDLRIYFNDQPAAEVASRGETRTTLLALKIVELKLLEESRGQKPLLLLDDVFSELDGARRVALTEAISGYQTFITTTDADIVVQHFLNNCHVIPLG